MGSMKLILTLTLTLTLTITMSSFLTLSLANTNTGKIAVYWGQEGGDGSLDSTCETGNYEIVFLSFLNRFGCKRRAALNLDAHCGAHTGVPCTSLGNEIKSCQDKGVKVFLALGGPTGPYSLCSSAEAKVVANYLYGNFLSGVSAGPLGAVTLDGIHFDIQTGSKLYWEDLLKELHNLRLKHGLPFVLSAAPQCFQPDFYLSNAIDSGHFDYIFVRFYNSPTCQYSPGNALSLLDSWDAWTSSVSAKTSLFLSLPAYQDPSSQQGYIPPSSLMNDVLPNIGVSSNYAGVALWDRSLDVLHRYSEQIKSAVMHPTNKILPSVAHDHAAAALY